MRTTVAIAHGWRRRWSRLDRGRRQWGVCKRREAAPAPLSFVSSSMLGQQRASRCKRGDGRRDVGGAHANIKSEGVN
uniref:Uncharacterized protein n=1 Tax=Oryza rufipogon TaxID=4529 RepID=A0A0E0RK28_ORYRU